ncbi:hypothetical protein PTI98_007156 [Pleurotus ostreatus]|nr:hypothetical protein PTI98_007156 [Pleurotus ostreatus]
MTRRGYIYQQKDDGSVDHRKLYQVSILAPGIKAAFFDSDGVDNTVEKPGFSEKPQEPPSNKLYQCSNRGVSSGEAI